MKANILRRVFEIVRDSIRVTKAFDAAAYGKLDQSLRMLEGLGEDTRDGYEVRLLKGALYSCLGAHERAVDELALAAQTVRATRRLSKAETNYLVAYAVQYWRHSAWEIGLQTKEIAAALEIQSPIEANLIPAHLRTKFPLRVEIVGVEGINRSS